MPNAGRCTHSKTNPKHAAFDRKYPYDINPHSQRLRCFCLRFQAKSSADPFGLCTCGHGNGEHMWVDTTNRNSFRDR
ncbi:hypothetical protein C8A03DRAFT_19760 [Achaetomium macrosporum]|uniref:Uncharacterized protein n=1 Tax=Achaetomium macrosporum TaxID=79813 RepID=A0AAN7H9P4_9PEZI|nr:hypothetical protein C8A03DRAFT_19760 [Achaetomium macrosporum]